MLSHFSLWAADLYPDLSCDLGDDGSVDGNTGDRDDNSYGIHMAAYKAEKDNGEQRMILWRKRKTVRR